QRLEAALKQKGIQVFARVDHAAGAKEVGIELRPTLLLIFGNPKAGTPLMQSNQTVGIDLPLKALIWEDADGKVWLTYNRPDYVAERHGIADRTEAVKALSVGCNRSLVRKLAQLKETAPATLEGWLSPSALGAARRKRASPSWRPASSNSKG